MSGALWVAKEVQDEAVLYQGLALSKPHKANQMNGALAPEGRFSETDPLLKRPYLNTNGY